MKFYKIKTWKLKNGWLKINSKFKMQWISHNIGLSAIIIVINIEKTGSHLNLIEIDKFKIWKVSFAV